MVATMLPAGELLVEAQPGHGVRPDGRAELALRAELRRIASLRNAFLTGLVLVAPLVVTIWALRLIIGFVGGSITPLFIPAVVLNSKSS